ncbi:DUF695 domain-containing protein [Microbacterium rhizosphaerae]|uniref:DUF695 domain-containing protein n=1 Tax=Microbacterium rhizosphaerae TaxID=1678237 RepID=A0ABZ0SQB7_9MICO|nr:DUF695 domain-containing protein [Microbacterium rhizosphaerae]WPR91358.1 DUF695 domain-containing protein [Microbacterium rhizosphaerae]
MVAVAFFRRTRPVPDNVVTHPISDFWDWWRATGHSVDPHEASALVNQLDQRVRAINDDLTWEFGAGQDARHRLTVSANGAPAIRPIAERWLRAAPPRDETWEFRSSKEAEPDALSNTLEIGGAILELARMRFGVTSDPDRLRLHVSVYHPLFADMSASMRTQVAFLVLDWLLGEDDVERWVGKVDAVVDTPPAVVDGGELITAAAALAREGDIDEWAVAQWHDENGNRGLASYRRALRWLDYPTLDEHHALTMSFASREDGLPLGSDELDTLRALEDELGQHLGASGVVVGHQTATGRRTFHVYTDSEDQNVAEALRVWSGKEGLSIESSDDAGWSLVRHLIG